jgi:hypothetical protein
MILSGMIALVEPFDESRWPMNVTNTEPLPKTLPGVVCVQRVRCGKPTCRCSRGKGHIAYYRFWREGGKLRKAYVKKADLADVRARCRARQEERRRLSRSWVEWRQLVALAKEAESCLQR